ncbi:MAG: DUF11 domain-containing protein [Pseudanabaena sp. SU_2_4]|nr:DUF11 domain-containing protein [Pseudanabaena sp. SU_2_4]
MAIINGTTESEFLDGNSEDDVMRSFEGDDTANGLDGNDDINGNQQNDIVIGDLGNDTLRGGQGNDTLSGGDGNDRIFGDLGDDVLYGDLGVDTLSGGSGDDLFAIGADTGGLALADADVILDFKGGSGTEADTIGLLGELTFDSLRITTSGNDTIIQDSLTGQFLAVVQNFTGVLTSADFTPTPDFALPEPEEVSVDLQILASDLSDLTIVGSNLTYIVRVINNSSSNATNVLLEALLPIGLEFVSASTSDGELLTPEGGALAGDDRTVSVSLLYCSHFDLSYLLSMSFL